MLSIVNLSEDHLEYVTDRPGHDFRYALDSSKIRQDLGYMPNIKSINKLENFLIHSLKNVIP